MVLGELGRTKIRPYIDMRMLTFWFKVVNGEPTKLSHIFYKVLLNLDSYNCHHAAWITTVKDLLYKYGLSNYWESQGTLSIDELSRFKTVCKKNIILYHSNEWKINVSNSSK